MRETEAGRSPGVLYVSPRVKEDLAGLDKDGESRRSAMNSLKQFVGNLDSGSMPRFLAQVSGNRDQGASRSYAISLYEEVARVHGKLIIPHISRVMTTVTRALSSSGSSPQLHQACAKVVSAVARYSVEEDLPGQADEILRKLCDPLLSVLAGKLESLAAGAAVCLQALVECEKWKYASDEIVHETCLRTTVALGVTLTRTVAHMQLARSLATTNPSFFDSYGGALLRTGSEVLRQTSASGTWQQRACAARLLQAVLPIVNKTTLACQLEPIIFALDDCKHDRMAHVRSAVSEALKTAKVLSSHGGRINSEGLSCDSRQSSGGVSCSGQPGQQGRRRPTTPEFLIPPLHGEKMGSNQQSGNTGTAVISDCRGRAFSSLEKVAIAACEKQDRVDLLVEEVSSNGTTVDIEVETDMDANEVFRSKESRCNQAGCIRHDNFRLVSSSKYSHRQTVPSQVPRSTRNLKTLPSAYELEESASKSRSQSVCAHAHSLDEFPQASSEVFVGHDCKETLDSWRERQSRHRSLLHLRSQAGISNPEKQRAFITAEDFLPFNTPRRLVCSLQSKLSSRRSGPPSDNVTEFLHGLDMPDVDLETTSEAGWSVRDNSVASNDSQKTDNEGDGKQQGNWENPPPGGDFSASKKTVIDGSMRNSSTELDANAVRVEDCEKPLSASVHDAESLRSMDQRKALKQNFLTEDAKILNDKLNYKVDGFCFSPARQQEGVMSMDGEQSPFCICSRTLSKGTGSPESGDPIVERDEQDSAAFNIIGTQGDKAMGVQLRRFHHVDRDTARKVLRRVQPYTEVLLTGLLLSVLAVPFSLVVSKILWSYLDGPGLIPT